MRTVAIIQARMGSTRLRGKSLMGICGEPLLLKVINQVKGSNLVSEVIVVTTNLEEDEPIVELCKKIKTYPDLIILSKPHKLEKLKL